MDETTAHAYAQRLNKTGITVTPRTAREHGPLASIWGIQIGRYDTRIYTHPDTFPPFIHETLRTACINCGTSANTRTIPDPVTGDRVPWCAPCYYGDAA